MTDDNDGVARPGRGRMRTETLFGEIFIIIRLAITLGVIYFVVASIIRERRKK